MKSLDGRVVFISLASRSQLHARKPASSVNLLCSMLLSFSDFLIVRRGPFFAMSLLGDFGPAPPGVDLEETQTQNIVVSVTVIMALGVSSVFLRLVARIKSGNRLAVDDYLVFVALVSCVASSNNFNRVDVRQAICYRHCGVMSSEHSQRRRKASLGGDLC